MAEREEAVETAARAAFFEDDLGGHIKGKWTYDTIPEVGRENYRRMVNAALTAAYPALRSQIERELGERLLSDRATVAAARVFYPDTHQDAGAEDFPELQAALQAALSTATHEGEGDGGL